MKFSFKNLEDKTTRANSSRNLCTVTRKKYHNIQLLQAWSLWKDIVKKVIN